MFKREGSEQETISNRDYKEASIILVGSIVILLGLGVWGVLQEAPKYQHAKALKDQFHTMLEKQSEKSNYPIRETIRSNQVTGEYAMQLNVELPTSGVTHEKLQRFLKSLPKVKEDYDVLVYQKGHADGILFLVRSNQEIIPQTSENHVYELKDSVSPTVMRGSDLAVQLGYETIESTFMRFVDHTQQSQYATDLMTTDYQKNNSTSQMDFDRVKQTQFHIESKAHEGIYAVIGFEAKTPTKTEQILQPLIYVDGQWKLAVPEEIPTKTRDTLIQELNEKDQSSQ